MAAVFVRLAAVLSLFVLVIGCSGPSSRNTNSSGPSAGSTTSAPAGQLPEVKPFVEYQPLILPLKFVLDEDGIRVQGDTSVMTPLGRFAIGATMPIIDQSQVLVIFRNTKRGDDVVYRLNAGRKLKVFVNGRVGIEIDTNGTVVIDTTDGQVESVDIYDKDQATPSVAMGSTARQGTPAPPVVLGSPVDWFPDGGELPGNLVLAVDKVVTNEERAKENYATEKYLDAYNKFGRVTGYERTYAKKDACSMESGIVGVYLYAAQYKSVSSLKSYIEWAVAEQPTPTVSNTNSEAVTIVGDTADLVWQNYFFTECQSPLDIRRLELAWDRLNVLGSVRVASIRGTVSDDYMLALATRLAQLMDAKIAGAAR